MIDTAVDELRQWATDREIDLEVSGADLTLPADRDRIIEVITNLLSNAIKFSPGGSKVELGVERFGEYDALFWVQDHGPGIALHDRERVFDRFYQVEGSNGREQPGSGLGLAIARAIVEQHHGRIWVESARGNGSTFKFTLPLAPSPIEGSNAGRGPNDHNSEEPG